MRRHQVWRSDLEASEGLLTDPRLKRGLHRLSSDFNTHGAGCPGRGRRWCRPGNSVYSLIESAKVNGVAPDEYLLEVCRRAKLTPMTVLLPWDHKREMVARGERE